jgi:SPX domain protein involved in polyphosphate accumulation
VFDGLPLLSSSKMKKTSSKLKPSKYLSAYVDLVPVNGKTTKIRLNLSNASNLLESAQHLCSALNTNEVNFKTNRFVVRESNLLQIPSINVYLVPFFVENFSKQINSSELVLKSIFSKKQVSNVSANDFAFAIFLACVLDLGINAVYCEFHVKESVKSLSIDALYLSKVQQSLYQIQFDFIHALWDSKRSI